MKTKIILLLFIVVFISSAILLFMVTNTFKKDKISYIYEVVTSQTQSIANQIENEIETINLAVSRIPLKTESQDSFNDIDSLKYFSVIKIVNGASQVITESIKDKFVKDPLTFQYLNTQIQKISQIDKKYFFSQNDTIYQVVLSQLQPELIAVIVGFESENANEFIENSKNDQFSFVLGSDLDILLGSKENLKNFSNFIDQNKTKKWEDSQSGKILSSQNESWIYSLSTVAGTELKVLNLVSEKKAFSVLQTIYFKSLVSFVLILSFVVILGILSATYLTDKLNQLTLATRKVADGQLDTEIEFKGHDEIASLSKDFNLMVRTIKKLLDETAEQARMETELKTAKIVQENLFPEAEKRYSNCAVIGYCKPASECGGDWWFHSEDDQFVNIVIADATGHGVSAALMTSAIKSAFILTAKMNLSTQETMSKINEALCEVGRSKVMMTAFYIRISKATNSAEYINASHEAPFILDLKLDTIDKGQLIFLNENNSARLGQANDTNYTSSVIQLSTNQRIFLYTDGIFDLKNNDLKKLSERSFYKKVIEIANEKTPFGQYSEEIKNFIFEYHTQKTLDDDVTLCHIEIT